MAIGSQKILLITGCEGFIGSNVARHLINRDKNISIIGCGSLNQKQKLYNINNLNLFDYWDKSELLKNLNKLSNNELIGIIHLGACSSTNEWDGKYLITNNTRYSNNIIDYCIENKTKMIHASSASVYGLRGTQNKDNLLDSNPLNMYAFSKLLTDNYLIKKYPNQKLITSFRFFNVFGVNEGHKVNMSSPIYTFNEEAKLKSKINLFEELDPSKFFKRDFICVDDVCELINITLNRNDIYGIYDLGTGKANSFKDVALEIQRWWKENGLEVTIQTKDFPEHLINSYQRYTCANMNYLKSNSISWRPKDTKTAIQTLLNKINIDYIV